MGAPQDIEAKYRLKDGTPVPRVSEVLDEIQGPDDVNGIADFAVAMNSQGKSWRHALDNYAEVGTQVHSFAETGFAAALSGQVAEPPQEWWAQVHPANQRMVWMGISSLSAWVTAASSRGLRVLAVEAEWVSERHGFGGTCDLLCELDGQITVIDLKTSSKSSFGKKKAKRFSTQLAAYMALASECSDVTPERAMVVRLNKTQREGPCFEEYEVKDIDRHWRIFRHGLAIHNLRKGVL